MAHNNEDIHNLKQKYDILFEMYNKSLYEISDLENFIDRNIKLRDVDRENISGRFNIIRKRICTRILI